MNKITPRKISRLRLMEAILVLTLFIIHFLVILNNPVIQNLSATTNYDFSGHYTEISPIFINGNAQFLEKASLEGWTGIGGEFDPIIITGYNITVERKTRITIINTNLHFQISNNVIAGIMETGILLKNVTNGVIMNNCIHQTHTDIKLVSSHYNQIINNYLGKLKTTGDYGYDIDGNYGIILEASHHNLIRENTIANHVPCGVYVADPINNTFANNLINFNRFGLETHNSSQLTIINNTLSNQLFEGLGLDDTTTSTQILNNDFIGNYRRSFIEHLLNPMNRTQAGDDGVSNSFAHNYWSDWASPDVDNNGVVDNPLLLSGGNKDYSPQSTPNQPKTAQDISLPLHLQIPGFYEILLYSIALILYVPSALLLFRRYKEYKQKKN
ncbi:MAG: right-handed parallel beta-helix repeat-containing protein [Candidatus Hermodarchaeota archaeon]